MPATDPPLCTLVYPCVTWCNLVCTLPLCTLVYPCVPLGPCAPVPLCPCAGMHYMHDKGVAHMDISAENVGLMAGSWDAKLIDFGCVTGLPSIAGGPLPPRPVGKLPYMAPEVRALGCCPCTWMCV